MKVQINTDKTLPWDQRNSEHFTEIISKELGHFRDQITRVEVHLSDENGSKKGVADIRCLMEVRVEGIKPFAGTNQADTVEQSITGAINKVKASLKTNLVNK